jgi:hypothetical protein
MRNKFLKIVVVTFGVVLLLLIIHQSLPWQFWFREEIVAGNEIAKNLENFRQQHGKYPNPDSIKIMLNLGFQLHTGYQPEYAVINDSTFSLTYKFGLDSELLQYLSSDRQWKHSEY